MKTQNLQEQKEKLEKQLKEVNAKIKEEKNKVDFIVIDGWAYETKEHNFNQKLGDVQIPEGKELWLPSECWKFYENKELREKLNLKDCWFFVQQVRENTKDVARFCAGSGRVDLWTCYSYGSDSSLGVRFKWKV